jgi:uncharacterized protein (DUF1778 family)
MTDLLQHAFETVRRLPPEAQDHIAEAMLALAAEEAGLDRVLFQVDPEVYAAFLARLDEPPQPNARLRKTMQTPAPRRLGRSAKRTASTVLPAELPPSTIG